MSRLYYLPASVMAIAAACATPAPDANPEADNAPPHARVAPDPVESPSAAASPRSTPDEPATPRPASRATRVHAPPMRVDPPRPAPRAAGDRSVRHAMRYPTRLARGPSGRLFVSDARVGSVFLLDDRLRPVGEIDDLAQPLGIAVDLEGRLYVGSQGRGRVEVYEPDGTRRAVIGEGEIRMPTHLALDGRGALYVTDSRQNEVRVYDPRGALLRVLGGPGDPAGQLRFPTGVALDERVGEIYIADQGNYRVAVFDLDGRFRRAFGGAPEAFTDEWQGRMVKVQALALDGAGQLHALDSYLNKVQILDAATGAYRDDYGETGRGPGQLALPLDLLVMPDGAVVVANAEANRVEVVRPAPRPAGEEE